MPAAGVCVAAFAIAGGGDAGGVPEQPARTVRAIKQSARILAPHMSET